MDTHDAVTQQGDTSRPARRIPAIAEALGYAGGALALAALMTLVAMFWGQLGVWGRSGICAVVAIAGFAGGLAFERFEEPASRRLSQFLLFIGVVAAGCTAGFLAHHFALQRLADSGGIAAARARAREWGWFVGTAAVAVSGGLVWRTRHTWLQHLAFGVGVGMASLLVLPLLPVEGPDWGAGLVIVLVGVAWGALALRGWLPPESAGLLLSSVGILGGIELMAIPTGPVETELLGWAVWLGFATSIALVVAGASLRRLVVVSIGAVGVVLFGIQLITEVYEFGLGTPITLLAIGLALVCGATYVTRRFAGEGKQAARVVTEIAGYVGAAFLTIGTATLIGEHWRELSTAARILVPAVVSIVAYTCGLLVDRTETDSAHRLSQALLGGGAIAAGATVAMIVYPLMLETFGPVTRIPYGGYRPGRDPANWASFAGALSAVLFGGATWSLRRGAFTEVVTGAACVMAVMSGFELVPDSQVRFWLPGATLLAIGLVWVVMGSRERFRPSNWAIGIGCTLSIMGTLMLQEGPMGVGQKLSVGLGIGLSAAAIAASLPLKRAVLLGFGAAGMVVFSFLTVQLFFEGELAGPIALLVTGVVFIAMAVLVARLMPGLRGGSSPGGRLKPS